MSIYLYYIVIKVMYAACSYDIICLAVALSNSAKSEEQKMGVLLQRLNHQNQVSVYV